MSLTIFPKGACTKQDLTLSLLVASLGLFLIAGCTCSCLAWRLEDLNRHIYSSLGVTVAKEDADHAWRQRATEQLSPLVVLLAVSAISASAATGLLLRLFFARLVAGG